MLTSKVPSDLKGRAMQVEHYLYDELWNHGPRKIPDEIVINKDENPKFHEQNSENDQKE